MEFAKNLLNKINPFNTATLLPESKDENDFLDICFLLDVTGSMGSYIKIMGECLNDLVYYFSSTFAPKKVYMSFVGYRDFGDNKEFEICDFQTVDINSVLQSDIYKKIKKIGVSGGGDTAENIKGAVEKAIKLKWRSMNKFVVLIADAPTHGTRYNGGCDDNYPNEDIEDAIITLTQNNIAFLGVEFSTETETMYRELQKIYANQNKAIYFELEDMKNLMKENTDDKERVRRFMDLIATKIKQTMFKIFKCNNSNKN